MSTYWEQAVSGARHPSDTSTDILYLRSFHAMRVVIGVLGVALPLVLLLGDALFLRSPLWPRGSISAYYHSAMRDEFVGMLIAIGFFLLCYHVSDRRLENWLSSLAGLAAALVAVFPTTLPPTGGVLTDLQRQLGEQRVAVIHGVSAVGLFSILALTSYLFGRREGSRPQVPGQRRRPEFWRAFHHLCAAMMVLGMVFVVVSKLTGVYADHATWFGEVVGLLAFGASWFAKGLNPQALVRAPAAAGIRPMQPLAGSAREARTGATMLR
jgi:hypothetical protein